MAVEVYIHFFTNIFSAFFANMVSFSFSSFYGFKYLLKFLKSEHFFLISSGCYSRFSKIEPYVLL